jgi:hypothetical protein
VTKLHPVSLRELCLAGRNKSQICHSEGIRGRCPKNLNFNSSRNLLFKRLSRELKTVFHDFSTQLSFALHTPQLPDAGARFVVLALRRMFFHTTKSLLGFGLTSV